MKERSFNAGRFAFLIDGLSVGFCKSFSGGAIKGIVAEHDAGATVFKRKHIANISHEPFTIDISTSMGKGMWEWIYGSFTQGHVTRSGQIISADHDLNAKRSMTFKDGHITEVTIPALDGSSKDPCYFTVKIDPEILRHAKESGKIQGQFGNAHKKWLASNWRFTLGSLPCERVAKIDSFTIKQTVVKDEVGAFREPTKHPGKLEVPNLTFYVSAADADAYEREFQSFVIDGFNDASKEMQGSIELLDPSLKETLGTIDLVNCGLISVEAEKHEANKEGVARMKVEIYVEEVKFDMVATDA